MAPVAFKTVYLFLALAALPHVLGGPACAHRNHGKSDCVKKCGGGWGTSSHYMGRNKWGTVISDYDGPSDDLDSMISTACGSTATLDPTATLSDPYPSSPSEPPSSIDTSSCTPPIPTTPSTLPASIPLSPLPSSPSPVPEYPSSSPPPPSDSLSLPSPSDSPSLPPPSDSPSSPPPSTPTTTDNGPSPSPTSTPVSSPAAQPSVTPNLTSDGSSISDEALAAHNSFRAKYGASDLTWSDDLAAAAEKWASGCVFQHSGGKVGDYGENLAAGTGDYTITQGTQAWEDEASAYDPNNPVASHFTQVVWKSTTQLGCAVVTCGPGTIFDASYGDSQFIVCEYNPPGNVDGEYAENVQA